MSSKNEGLPSTWDEIKKASRRLDRGGKEKVEKTEKQVLRRYLSARDRDDQQAEEQPAIPGYN